MNKRLLLMSIFVLLLIVVIIAACLFSTNQPKPFSGARALQLVSTQLAFGPRNPGTRGHAALQKWIINELQHSGWNVHLDQGSSGAFDVVNITATRSHDKNAQSILIGAHYDSREFADNDPLPANRVLPVPAANDGASGVAVLLELARTLPKRLPVNVTLVFFDFEDQGRIRGADWIIGSTQYAQNMQLIPDQVIIIDMIGDKDQNIYIEKNSDPALTAAIWGIAEQKGHGAFFINQPKYSMMDDHTPFLNRGIRAIDIIDFDYPHWHTTNDTAENVSAEALQRVGEVLTEYLINFTQYQSGK